MEEKYFQFSSGSSVIGGGTLNLSREDSSYLLVCGCEGHVAAYILFKESIFDYNNYFKFPLLEDERFTITTGYGYVKIESEYWTSYSLTKLG